MDDDAAGIGRLFLFHPIYKLWRDCSVSLRTTYIPRFSSSPNTPAGYSSPISTTIYFHGTITIHSTILKIYRKATNCTYSRSKSGHEEEMKQMNKLSPSSGFNPQPH